MDIRNPIFETSIGNNTVSSEVNPEPEINLKPEIKSEMDQQNIKILLKKLENEGMQNVNELNNQQDIISDPLKMIDSLEKIMKNGSDEFKEKTGRPMSYSEMRSVYG
jgi:hypothetical protein